MPAEKHLCFLIGALLLLSTIFSGPAAAAPANNNAAASGFRVGVILPLSGANASIGNYLRNGILLAHGSLPPALRDKVKLFFEDDQLLSSRSVSAFNKLVDINRIHAALVLGSGVGNALAPLAERQKIVLIAIGASDRNVVADRNFAFIHWITPETEAKTLLTEMRKRNYQRIALLYQEQEGAIAVYRAVARAFDEAGMKSRLAMEEQVNYSDDFKTFIARARARNVDAVVVALFPGMVSSFARQAYSSSWKPALVGLEMFEDANEVKASDGALIGQWYVNADDAAPEFVSNYKAAYGDHPGWAAANAYDSLKLISAGFERYGADSTRIAEFLHSLKDYSGAAGQYSASGDNRFILPATIKIVTETGFEKASSPQAKKP